MSSAIILAPPVPSVIMGAGTPTTGPILTPREQMRLAKLAAIQDEASEVEASRERRKSQRSWSLALDWETRRASGSGSTGRSGSRRVSEAGSVTSETALAQSPPLRAIRPAPQSILRKSSFAPSDAPLSPTSPLRNSITDSEVSEFGQCSTTGSTSSRTSSMDVASSTSRPEMGRRRSSKVRFSEQLLPSANSTPISSIIGSREGSVDFVQPVSPLDKPSMGVTGPSTENQPSTPPSSFPGPVSPTFVVRKAKHLPRLSAEHNDNSIGSDNNNRLIVRPSASRRSSAASVASMNSNLPGTSRLSQGLEDMFKAQPLPYSKLDKVLARLSTENGGRGSTSSTSTVSSGSGEDELASSPGKPTSEASSGRSSIVPPPTTLRQALDRSSLSSLSPSNSVILRTSLSEHSYSVSSSASGGSGVSGSTGSSFSSGDIIVRSSTPGSLRLSGNASSFATMGEYLARASTFSVSTQGLSAGSLSPMSPLGSIMGQSCYFTRPEVKEATEAQLMVNRGVWEDPEAGLSPRSTPTPVAPDAETMGTPLQPAEWDSPVSMTTRLPIQDVGFRQHADSIDMLPIISRASMDSATSTSTSFSNNTTAQATLICVDSVDSQRARGHQKNDSDFSMDLSFPLPPSRLAVKFGKLSLSAKKRTSVNAAPVVLAVETMVEQGTIVEDEDEGAQGDTEHEDANRLKSGQEVQSGSSSSSPASARPSPLALTTPTIPYSEGSSLTAALRSIGSPTTDKFLVPHSPTKQAGGLRLDLTSGVDSTPQRPPSPDISTMMSQTIESLRRRKSSVYPYAQYEEEDSDIDLAAPLEQVAYRSKILSPNSRLLSPCSSPSKSRRASRRASTISSSELRSGMGLTSGKGWSGSESEEEEWTTSLRLINNRKNRKSVLPIRTASGDRPTSVVPQRPAWAKEADRYSQASQTSTISSLADSEISYASTELLTPSGSMDMPHQSESIVAPALQRTASTTSSSSTSTLPGNFAWGKSSPDQSPRLRAMGSGAFGRRSSSRSIGSNASATFSTLPTPTRNVEGWGNPELMFGESTDEESGAYDAMYSLKRSLIDEDATPRPPTVSVVPTSANVVSLDETASKKAAGPPSPHFFQATAQIEDRLAGLFGRLPIPRTVSDPIRKHVGGEDKKEVKVESRIPQRPRPVSRVIKTPVQEEQCAACRFF